MPKFLREIPPIFVLLILTSALRSEEPPFERGAVLVRNELRIAATALRALAVAAHPDDEDGTSLIVMRRKFGAHTVSLFSTFGEGGQNAIARVDPATHGVKLFHFPRNGATRT